MAGNSKAPGLRRGITRRRQEKGRKDDKSNCAAQSESNLICVETSPVAFY